MKTSHDGWPHELTLMWSSRKFKLLVVFQSTRQAKTADSHLVKGDFEADTINNHYDDN